MQTSIRASTGLQPPRERRGPRVVFAHVPRPGDHASSHELCTLLEYARRIAVLRGETMGGFYDPAVAVPGPVYLVPATTLTAAEADDLCIDGPDDLFGGVVPFAFVGTKAISHPLVGSDACAPPGWNPAFTQQASDTLLAGFSAFSPADARAGGLRLLAGGRVRVKPVHATGGRGQVVVQDATALQSAIDALDPADLATHGVVLEEDVAEEATLSIGQVQVAGLVGSYFGVQTTTADNRGCEVFGGSALTVARGGFDALLALQSAPEVRQAIVQAQGYEAAVRACYPGFHASRSNYDVLLGRDAGGRRRSAVLEQSWRVGGATGPEIAALEVFRADPRRQSVCASCLEIFGESPEPPSEATVYFRGIDPEVGWLTKYTVVERDVHAR